MIDFFSQKVIENEPAYNETKSNFTAPASVTNVPDRQVTSSPPEVLPSQTKVSDKSLFDDSDSSDGELFKPKGLVVSSTRESVLKNRGLKANAKINSSLLGSESDDSILNSQAAIPTPPKINTPSFLLEDSDDDGNSFVM